MQLQNETDQTVFNSICRLAETKDKNGLQNLLESIWEDKDYLSSCLIYIMARPVELYAKKGQKEVVDFLCEHFQAPPNKALKGYAQGGHFQQVNAFLEEGHHDVANAVEGYLSSGFLDLEESKLTRTLAFTSNGEFRKRLTAAAQVNGKLSYSQEYRLLIVAEKLNVIMREYQLDFKQASSLLLKGTRAWLLEGIGLMNEASDLKLPLEIFLHVSSFVTGLACSDTVKVMTAVNKRLLLSSVGEITTKLKAGFFSYAEYKRKHEEICVKYETRQSYTF